MAEGKKGGKKAEKAPVVPDRIYAQASPRSLGGVSMFEARGPDQRGDRRQLPFGSRS